MDPWTYLLKLREDMRRAAQDRERRLYHAHREGFARSGEPSPIPVYNGPPAPGGQRSGIVTANALGTGAAIIVDINNGSDKRTWVYNVVYAVVAGQTTHIDKDHFIIAQNGAQVLGTIVVSEHGAGPTTSHIDDNYARVPSTRLRLVVTVSTLNTIYVITGIWEEDR